MKKNTNTNNWLPFSATSHTIKEKIKIYSIEEEKETKSSKIFNRKHIKFSRKNQNEKKI